MATLINLNRSSYLKLSARKNSLDYLTAKYLNIRFSIAPERNFLVTAANVANTFGIAYQVYGNKNYWWVVAMYNGIINPIEDLKPGDVLQLPSLTAINAFLTRNLEENSKVTI
jgi:hypothetical protein